MVYDFSLYTLYSNQIYDLYAELSFLTKNTNNKAPVKRATHIQIIRCEDKSILPISFNFACQLGNWHCLVVIAKSYLSPKLSYELYPMLFKLSHSQLRLQNVAIFWQPMLLRDVRNAKTHLNSLKA